MAARWGGCLAVPTGLWWADLKAAKTVESSVEMKADHWAELRVGLSDANWVGSRAETTALTSAAPKAACSADSRAVQKDER